MMNKIFALLCIASAVLNPLVAQAQELPSYAEYDAGVARIQGRIAGIGGTYDLTVRDERGYIDRVHIHPGTIINPTGLTLAPGMVVSIIGENQGPYFNGDEIDTPYSIYGGVPCYQGHPWTYFGAGLALGFFFTSWGWWHGDYFSHYGYGWSHGYRYYRVPGYRGGIPSWNRYGGGGYHAGYYGGYHHTGSYGHASWGHASGGGTHGGWHGGGTRYTMGQRSGGGHGGGEHGGGGHGGGGHSRGGGSHH